MAQYFTIHTQIQIENHCTTSVDVIPDLTIIPYLNRPILPHDIFPKYPTCRNRIEGTKEKLAGSEKKGTWNIWITHQLKACPH